MLSYDFSHSLAALLRGGGATAERQNQESVHSRPQRSAPYLWTTTTTVRMKSESWKCSSSGLPVALVTTSLVSFSRREATSRLLRREGHEGLVDARRGTRSCAPLFPLQLLQLLLGLAICRAERAELLVEL